MTDFVSNDTASVLEIACVLSGAPIDLTGSSVALHWDDELGDPVSRDMDIDDAQGGICSYRFQSGELFAPSMEFEVEITDQAGYRLTCLDLISVAVRREIA